MNLYGFNGSLVVLVCGADFGSFVAGVVVVFYGDACGGFGWCCAWWLMLLLGEG